MAQDQNDEKVLIARNNETGQVGAVVGQNPDGTPKMADVKSAKLSDLVKFSKGQNPLEAFMSNFLRQAKNPSLFGLFSVPAAQYDSVGKVTADLAQDAEANAAMLAPYKVDPTAYKVEQKQEAPQQMSQSNKWQAVDESKIDWGKLKEKWGIDRDALEKSGDLKEMLYNRKSKLVTVTPTFGGEKFTLDARLSFRTDPDGSVKVVPHFIHHEPKLDQAYKGYEFSKEDKAALKATGNLGKVVELNNAMGEKIPSFVSIDRYTNEIVSTPVSSVYLKDTIGQTKLTMPEIMRLKEGKAIGPKEIIDKNGKTYNVVLQVSADRRGVEFVPGSAMRKEQSQTAKEKQGNQMQQSSWLTKDGKIRPISKWAGVPLSEQQQTDYAAGKVVKMENMIDKKGQPCTVYLYFNPEKQRPNTSLNDPGVKIANESKTQKAVNNDGLTNEATKNVVDPIKKGQTQPEPEQKKKPKGPKL